MSAFSHFTLRAPWFLYSLYPLHLPPFHPNPQMNRILHLHLGLTLPCRLERLATPFVGIAPICVSNSGLVDHDVLYHMYLYSTPLMVSAPPWPQLSIIPPMLASQSDCETLTSPPFPLLIVKT